MVKKEAYTVYDVARLAGVSPSTVSRVLTGVARVSPEKESRIRRVMEEVNFRPNAFARSLLLKRSQTLGVILPDITSLFFSQTFLELERAAFERGYSLLLGNTLNSDHSPERDLETFYLNALHDRQVEGILLMGGRINDTVMEESKREELVRLNQARPLVTINGTVTATDICGVRSDEEAGVGALVDHLVGLGHRDFALLGGIEGITAFDLKRRALVRSLATHGLALAPDAVVPTGFSLGDGVNALDTLMSRGRRTTALVAVNDTVAMGVLRRAAAMGLRVPQDVSVTGFDDIQMSEFLVPSLTTVNHGYTELAQAAVTVVLDRIAGRATPAETVVPVRPVFRESTGPRTP